MFKRSLRFRIRRRGATSPVVVVLLAGILVALIVLIFMVVLGRHLPDNYTGNAGSTTTAGAGEQLPKDPAPAIREKPQTAGPALVTPGQTVSRDDLPLPARPKKPEPIGNPERIQEVLQKGRIYEVLAKGGLAARVEDKDWGVHELTNLAFRYELPATRAIEENDGKTIVEVRQFGKIDAAKLLTVESVTIDLGPPGALGLGLLTGIDPETGAAILSIKQVIEGILGQAAQAVADSQAKVVWQLDSLSGKKVRITFADGVGVQSIQPIGCSLTTEERDYVFGQALLSDAYTMRLDKKPGETWTIDGSQLVSLLDPTMRGVTKGVCKRVSRSRFGREREEVCGAAHRAQQLRRDRRLG